MARQAVLPSARPGKGSLETMLDRVATYKEKTEILKGKIKKALTYPVAVVVVGFILFIGKILHRFKVN